jgi:CRP-like cAMP-binding protein
VNFIFSLVKGKVMTFKMNDEGKEIIIGLHKEGDIFGHASFLENSQKEFCTAIEASELIYIPKEEFLQILDSNSDVALKFIKSVLCLYLEAGDKMLKLAYNSSTKKIGDALVSYSHTYQDGQADFLFDRGDIATLAGVAKESVSRKLSDFKAKGLIKMDGRSGHIKLKDGARFGKF